MHGNAIRHRLLFVAVALLMVSLPDLARGAAHDQHGHGSVPTVRGDDDMKTLGYEVLISAETREAVRFGEIAKVFVIGPRDGKPVVLLHELPGLRPEDVDLGVRLGSSFRVYVPLLFGAAGDTKNGKREVCKTGLFACFSREASHRILGSLRQLVAHACADAPCGVIGMCLTGSIPLSLVHDGQVRTIVLAQPSLPFPRLSHPRTWFGRGIDISADQVARALTLDEGRALSIDMIRFRHDLISSHKSFQQLKSYVKHSIGTKSNVSLTCREVPGRVFDHSSLVFDTRDEKGSLARIQALKDLLIATLVMGQSPAGPCE